MNIWQRTVSHFVSATTEWFLSYMFNMADQGTRMAKLGPNAHGFFGYRKGAQSAIFFTNTKFGYDVAQPVLPNEILVGPLLDPSPIPPLPPDLANWLDKDKNVVYVNFGTSGYLLPHQLKMLHMALKNLIPKYRVLWRTYQVAEHNTGDFRIVPWLPSQPALLSHSSIQFIFLYNYIYFY
eukprot:Phypoly_transcript_06485.p1 GENE.Phypoly_transcript_06485~~Phypoly_transcript_06485.p1  ORF type:complete len:180 (+),score=17.59 Phypoly_transcript_06485:437-976(+)